MCENLAGTGARRYWIGQMSFAYIGKGFSQTEINVIIDAIIAYGFFLI